MNPTRTDAIPTFDRDMALDYADVCDDVHFYLKEAAALLTDHPECGLSVLIPVIHDLLEPVAAQRDFYLACADEEDEAEEEAHIRDFLRSVI